MEDEIWKPVVGFETHYEVSSWGRIKRIAPYRNTYPGRILAACKGVRGYQSVGLYVNGVCHRETVHKLVYEAFVGLVPEGKNINHIDGVKTNNRVDNLEATTQRENLHHAYKLGLRHHGEEHPRAKLTWEQVAEIRAKYVKNVYGIPKLAKEYGVGWSTVADILDGTHWQPNRYA
jgi:hypothetical protein